MLPVDLNATTGLHKTTPFVETPLARADLDFDSKLFIVQMNVTFFFLVPWAKDVSFFLIVTANVCIFYLFIYLFTYLFI